MRYLERRHRNRAPEHEDVYSAFGQLIDSIELHEDPRKESPEEIRFEESGVSFFLKNRVYRLSEHRLTNITLKTSLEKAQAIWEEKELEGPNAFESFLFSLHSQRVVYYDCEIKASDESQNDVQIS